MKSLKKIFRGQVLSIYIALIAIVILFSILSPNFRTFSNLLTVLRQIAGIGIMACGMMFVMLLGNVDLSVGTQISLLGIVMSYCMVNMKMGIFPAILIGIVLGLAIGLINGLVVSKLHVPAFIGSYGMQTIVYGIALIYTGAQPIGGLIPEYTDWAAGSFLNIQLIPNLAVVTAIVMLVMWFLYNHTPYGKKMYAIGGNPDAAEVSGINTTRMTIASYMIAASLFALAGFMLGAKAGGTSSNLANGYELFAIAGCTIGGVSVNGGTGKVSGILMGVLVFEILKIEMTFLGIDTAWTYIVQGIVIVVAIALDIRKYIAKR